MQDALAALKTVDFDWTTHIDSIWRDLDYDVPELQAMLRNDALLQIENLFTNRHNASPLGLVLAGPGGSGKTHLLSLLRRSVLARGAFFVLVDMTDVREFWDTTLLGYIRSLAQQPLGASTQHERLLVELCAHAGARVTLEQLKGGRPPKLINVCDTLITGLRQKHSEMQEHQDVLRALVLFGSDDLNLRDLGWKWLQAIGVDDQEKLKHGFQRNAGDPREIVRGISFLMSLIAPTLLALDQLDAIVAELQLVTESSTEDGEKQRSAAALAIIQGIAKGLIALRDTTARTQTAVACLEQTWSVLAKRTLGSMHDRFHLPLLLRPVVEVAEVQRLIEQRLQSAYNSSGFKPPYTSFPFKPSFFAAQSGASPREVLKKCEQHRLNCLRSGSVTEVGTDTKSSRVSIDPPVLRARFDAFRAKADIERLLADEDEDSLDKLLEAACHALVAEHAVPADVDALVDLDFAGPGNYEPLHARVRVVYRAEAEREKHYAVRFLQKKNHLAFQARLKAAMTASGIDHSLGFRKLVLFRNGPVPPGAGSARLIEEFHKRGGVFVEPNLDELRDLWALSKMLEQGEERMHVRDWLCAAPIVSRMPTFADAA
ncbi:MAG TPA: hypothetical protein VGI70_17880, partial [Polyangiales bacterium]